MKRTRYIAVIVAMLVAASMAFAQRGRQRGGPPGRFGGPPPRPSQPVAPQPRPQQPPPANQDQQRSFDRFILHGPGPHAGSWLRKHEDLSPADQRKALEADPQFQKLSPDRQQQLLQRLERFNSLPPDRRHLMLQRMETWEHLSPQDREKARELFHSYRQLPSARQSQLNFALRDLRAMNPDDRQKALDSNEYRARFTDQERDLLRSLSDMELVPNRAPQDEP